MTSLYFQELSVQAGEVWRAGGWAMNALAFNAIVIFGMGMLVLVKLAGKGLFASPERAWSNWEAAVREPRGVLERVIGEAMESRTLGELEHGFDAVKNDELNPFERDLRVIRIAVTTAPLLGLLGTVTGMLATFNALATGGGGDKTMGMIASGISEALITTEAGLVLALSGMMFQYVLTRQHARFCTQIEHVESRCMQEFRRRTVESAG